MFPDIETPSQSLLSKHCRRCGQFFTNNWRWLVAVILLIAVGLIVYWKSTCQCKSPQPVILGASKHTVIAALHFNATFVHVSDCIYVADVSRTEGVLSSKVCFGSDPDDVAITVLSPIQHSSIGQHPVTRIYDYISPPEKAKHCGRYSDEYICCWTRELLNSVTKTHCFKQNDANDSLVVVGGNAGISFTLANKQIMVGVKENDNLQFIALNNDKAGRSPMINAVSRHQVSRSFSSIGFAFPGVDGAIMLELVEHGTGQVRVCNYTLQPMSGIYGLTSPDCFRVPFRMPERSSLKTYKHRFCSTKTYMALLTYDSEIGKGESAKWELQLLHTDQSAASVVTQPLSSRSRSSSSMPLLAIRCAPTEISVFVVRSRTIHKYDIALPNAVPSTVD